MEPFVRSDGDGAFHDVWSLPILDDFIATAPRTPLIRLVRAGEPIDSKHYTSKIRLGGADLSDVIDPSKVAAQFAAGVTVVAQSLHRTQPVVASFIARLIDEVSHPVQANAYLTPPLSTGLAPHSDRHDVFILQVHGSKRWTVDGLGETELVDGDVMYLPAGTQHSATSTDHASLHLTVGILRVTYRSVIERILHNAPASLDDPLPLRYRDHDVSDTAAIGEAIVERLDDVVAHLLSVDADAVAESEQGRRGQALSDRSSLRRSVGLLELDGSETIVKGHREWTVSSGEGRVSVDDGRQRLVAPDACLPAVGQLTTGATCIVGALEGLDAAGQLVLARRLLAVGLCELAQ